MTALQVTEEKDDTNLDDIGKIMSPQNTSPRMTTDRRFFDTEEKYDIDCISADDK